MTGSLLITGANGFVGHALVELATARGLPVRAAVRGNRPHALPPRVSVVAVGPVDGSTDWSAALHGVSHVIHTVGRAHVTRREDPAAAAALFRAVNVDGTTRLAEQAAEAGVRRLVHVSSIKAVAERSYGRALREDDTPAPEDDYGRSKLAAETALLTLAERTAMEIAIARPPLIYGPGVRANFLRLMEAVARGFPLPFGAVHNRRSLVYLENFADALLHLADAPAAAGSLFHVSDDPPLSVAELVRRLARAMERPARLLRIPPRLLLAAGRLAGGEPVVRRLVENLEVDSSRIRLRCAWNPPLTPDEGFRRTAAWYLGR